MVHLSGPSRQVDPLYVVGVIWPFFLLSVLHFRPNGRSVKNRWRRWSGLFVIVRARCMMASSFAFDRQGVGRLIICHDVCAILRNIFLLFTVSRVKNTGRAVHEDGVDDTFVALQEEMAGHSDFSFR